MSTTLATAPTTACPPWCDDPHDPATPDTHIDGYTLHSHTVFGPRPLDGRMVEIRVERHDWDGDIGIPTAIVNIDGLPVIGLGEADTYLLAAAIAGAAHHITHPARGATQ